MKSRKDSVSFSSNAAGSTFPESRGLRIADAAKYLSVTPCFVRALITTSEIPYVIAGKRFILDRYDLDRWLESRKQTGGADMIPTARSTPDDIWRSPTWVMRKNEEVEHARTAKHDPAASEFERER